MSGFSREQVGVVKSESGMLVLVCPKMVTSLSSINVVENAQGAVRNDGWCGPTLEGMAFAVPIHDGEYPVYGTYGKNGELLGIEIDLREDR